MQRYSITIMGIQETKWFGSDMWLADKGWETFLHCGRSLQSSNESAQCGKGVVIIYT